MRCLYMQTGMVRDQKGRFQVRMNERETKLVALSALLGRVGVKVTPAPVQTVHIDVDLDAPESEQADARAEAESNVRQACERMGQDPEACLRKLAAVFAALPCAQTALGQEASAAISASLNEKSAPMHPCANWGKVAAASANADQCPPPPEAFDCGDGEDSNCGADAEPSPDCTHSVREMKARLRQMGVADEILRNCVEKHELEALLGQATERAQGATGTKAGQDADMDCGLTAPYFKWQEQLQTLRAMGLDDPADGVTEWELVLLLEKHLGSLDRVVDSLIERKTEMSFDMV
jgi:hypothetical protein